VNPLELEYFGELAMYTESTNRDTNATCGEFATHVRVVEPETVAPSLGAVI
jgi:hypothetical protein